jgi:riboflavin-specific deaminase-like protein
MRWLQELEQLKSAGVRPRSRPFVTAAFAISCDGCLSRTRGQATRISGPDAMRVTHQLRAVHDALLVGVGTVLSDDPLLTTRLVAGPSPLRVVLDSRLRVPVSARLLSSTPRPAWLLTTDRAPQRRARVLRAAGADLQRVAGSRDGVSLRAALALLLECGVHSLMVEGGAALLESFFRAGYVDYLAVTVSPLSLRNPDAVPLGGCAAEALRGWRASERAMFDCDRLEAGPWQRARDDLAHTPTRLVAP